MPQPSGPARPPSPAPADIPNRAIRARARGIAKAHYGRLLLVSLLYLGPNSLFNVLLALWAPPQPLRAVLAGVVYAAIFPQYVSCLYTYLLYYRHGQAPRGSLFYCWRRPALLRQALLLGLLYAGLSTAVGVVTAVVPTTAAGPELLPFTLFMLGVLLLNIYIMLRLLPAGCALASETGATAGRAIRRSMRATAGKAGRALGMMFAFVGWMLLAMAAVSLLLAPLQLLNTTLPMWAYTPLLVLAMVLVMPYMGVSLSGLSDVLLNPAAYGLQAPPPPAAPAE